MRTQLTIIVAAFALSLGACDKKAPAGKLGDLSTSLAAARTDFNAHKGEARFLTLLSPT